LGRFLIGDSIIFCPALTTDAPLESLAGRWGDIDAKIGANYLT
jgi:hypothetical protein